MCEYSNFLLNHRFTYNSNHGFLTLKLLSSYEAKFSFIISLAKYEQLNYIRPNISILKGLESGSKIEEVLEFTAWAQDCNCFAKFFASNHLAKDRSNYYSTKECNINCFCKGVYPNLCLAYGGGLVLILQ